MVGRSPFDIWIQETSGSEQLAEHQGHDRLISSVLTQAASDVNRLSLHDRHRLLVHWIDEIRSDTTDELYEEMKTAQKLQKQMENVYDEVDRRILQDADVIGVTTTGLAKKTTIFKRLRAKVIICEEAGEVMEPHMLSAMLPSVEHFIQIGDHEQLRPQINNHDLSMESQQGQPYQLDRSQFERLSIGERGRPSFPLAQLNLQRRMRPEISAFIRQLIYPRLLDHEVTNSLPDVVGMRSNVFWFDHTNLEEGAHADMHSKSQSNLWEVEMTHALVRHILRQGIYKSTDIAVLTPYTGQLQQLRKRMRQDFEIVLSDRDEDILASEGFTMEDNNPQSDQGAAKTHGKPLEKKRMSELLRVATVDNFQGEEAKVVIVSLVRSNKAQRVGFLKTRNRINVLISRAQHGMYLIGNAETYSGQSTWSKIQDMLRASDALGDSLALCCPRHPLTEIKASNPEDFSKNSPEGGCQLTCDRRLPECGHKCQAKCHSQSMHQIFACP